jgi:4-carboxymuconolactone decarboxylase
MTSERYEAGLEYLQRAQGEQSANRIEAALRSISASYADYSISATYGDVFTREGLDLRSRQLVTIAVLAALGDCEPQLRLHIRAGLNMGLEGDEIVEVIVQVAAYAGAPRASNAMRVAGEVFSRQGITVK